MEYSKEIKKKAISFANAVATGNITLSLQVKAKYMSRNSENHFILLNFLADFQKEINLSKRFENWLRQKGIEQNNLFGVEQTNLFGDEQRNREKI
jgi:hypothetical protein